MSKAATTWPTSDFDRGPIGDIARRDEGGISAPDEIGPGPFELFAVATDQCHAQAHLGQGRRDAPADAASRPCHQCRFQVRCQGNLLPVQASIPASRRSGPDACRFDGAPAATPIHCTDGPIGATDTPRCRPTRVSQIGPRLCVRTSFENGDTAAEAVRLPQPRLSISEI